MIQHIRNAPPVALPTLVRAAQAARLTGICYTTLRSLSLRGELPCVRLGRAWYFHADDIRVLVERNTSREAQL